MKEQYVTDSQWASVPNVRIPPNIAQTKIRVFTHIDSREPNRPLSNARVSYAKEDVVNIRAAVAHAIAPPRTATLDEFRQITYDTSKFAVNILNEKNNIPQAIKEIARTLHPRNPPANRPGVSIGAVNLSLTSTGFIDVVAHRAGFINIFVHDPYFGWEEVLTSPTYTFDAQKNINRANRYFYKFQKDVIEEHGKNSLAYKELVKLNNEAIKKATSHFRDWECPPLGPFFKSRKLQKVKNNYYHDVDAVFMVTSNAGITKADLDKIGPPKNISGDFITTKHEGKKEVSASAIALSL